MLSALALVPLLWHQDAEYLIVDGHILGARTSEGWTRPRPESMPDVIQAASIEWATPSALPASFRFTDGPNSQEGFPIGTFYSGKAWEPRTASPSQDRAQAMRVARRFAQNQGINRPSIYLNQLLEVDLDGDGSSEQIITASSRPRLHQLPIQSNDWTAVLLRWRGPSERVFPLAFSSALRNQGLSFGALRSIVDFDGDGQIEIVTTSIGPSLKVLTLWTFNLGKLVPKVETTLET